MQLAQDPLSRLGGDDTQTRSHPSRESPNPPAGRGRNFAPDTRDALDGNRYCQPPARVAVADCRGSRFVARLWHGVACCYLILSGVVHAAEPGVAGAARADWVRRKSTTVRVPGSGSVAGCGRAVGHGAARTGPDRGAVRTLRAARARPRWWCPGRRGCRGGGPAGCGSCGGPQRRRCAGSGSRR